jgi:hypothetical protein
MDSALIQRLMNLYINNDRFHGLAIRDGATITPEGKSLPGHIMTSYSKLGEEDWNKHLEGEIMIGVAPLLDDGKVWWVSLDIDHLVPGQKYDFNPIEEVAKVNRSGLPLVVDQSKSGGIHIKIFFSEPVPADVAVRVMRKIRAHLGYGNNEIFPKQTSYADTNGGGSWMFIVYGPTWDIFQAQVGLNGSGGHLTLLEYVVLAESKRISYAQLLELEKKLGPEESSGHKGNGSNRGNWRDRTFHKEGKSEDEITKELFKDGPPCLFQMTCNGRRVSHMRNDFLLGCRTLFMKKYDNWQEALHWVNECKLEGGPGNFDKFQDMARKTKEFEYKCKDEPLCSYCHSDACRRMPFGVGCNSGRAFMHDITLTMQKGKPVKYFLEGLSIRVELNGSSLEYVHQFRTRLRDSGINPGNLTKKEFDDWLTGAMETMEVIEPPKYLQANADFREALAKYFDGLIPSLSHRCGQEFLDGKVGDHVRVKMSNQRIYFKRSSFISFCERTKNYKPKDVAEFKQFMFDLNGEHHDKHFHMGRWFRGTWSVGMDEFEDYELEKWGLAEKRDEQSVDVAEDESDEPRPVR